MILSYRFENDKQGKDKYRVIWDRRQLILETVSKV